MLVVPVFLYLFLLTVSSLGSEPVCSRFHYEEQTLAKMIRQEILVEKMKTDLEDTKQQVLDALKALENDKEQFASDLERKTNGIEVLKENMDKAMDLMKIQNDENIEAYTAEMENIKDSVVTPVVAFKAHVVSETALSSNTNAIIFSQNLLNVGDAYSNKTGVFVVPVRGIYHFSAQFCLYPKTYAYFGITLNGTIISGALLGEQEWHKCYTMDSITAAYKGDEVTVKCTESCSSSENLWSSPPRATSSFAGILIHSNIDSTIFV